MLDVGGGDWTPPGELLAQVFPSPPPPRPVNDVPPGPMPIAPTMRPVATRPVNDVAPYVPQPRAVGPIPLPLPPQQPQSFGPPQTPDAITRNIAAVPIPLASAGVTPEFVRSLDQVGYGPQARYAAQPDPGGYPRYEPTPAAELDVPANYLQRDREQRAIIAANTQARGLSEPNLWEKQPSGRPTETRMGMPLGQGGLGQPNAQTWQPSNAVMQQALKELPPVFERFKNLKIDRPTVHMAYGHPDNVGGYYSGAGTPIVVGRGAGTGDFGGTPGTPETEIVTAKHELLHALSYEMPPYKDDAANDFKALGEAIAADRPALEGAQAYRRMVSEIGYFGASKDWGHVWTAIAMHAANGISLPPALKAYFAPMMAPAGVTAP